MTKDLPPRAKTSEKRRGLSKLEQGLHGLRPDPAVADWLLHL